MERHRKKRGSLVFLFNRAESELITSQFGDPRCVRPSVRTRGNIFRLYRPIPSGFTAFRSISRSAGRSVDQRLSYQRNQLTINQELAPVRPTEALTLLNRTLPNQNLLYRKLLNRNLPNQETAKLESAKPYSAKPESAKTRNRNLLNHTLLKRNLLKRPL